MRVALALLVLLAVGLAPGAARAAPPDDRTIVEALQSDDPREVAWAAWEAAEGCRTVVRPHVIPLLERLAARRRGTETDDPLIARLLEDESRWQAWILEEHALDLAIRLEVLPPTRLLTLYTSGGRPSAVTVLLAHPDPPADALLAVFDGCCDSFEPEAWIALGNLMARKRTPGFAAAVLREHEQLRILRVWDDDEEHPDLLRPIASICFDGFHDRPAGWPPTVVYRLAHSRITDEEHRVRWSRGVVRDSRLGFGGVTGTWPNPHAVREGWLRRLGASLETAPPARYGYLHLRYVGRQPWDRDLTAWLVDQHDRHWRFVAGLFDLGLLTRAEAIDARPRLRIELEDRRDDRRHPLPFVPEVVPWLPSWLVRRLGALAAD